MDAPFSLKLLRFTADFHDWANERILRAALQAGPGAAAARIPGSYGDGSLHALLAHLVASERHWLARWQGNPEARLDGPATWPTLEAVHAAWEEARPARAAFFAGLDEAALRGICRYRRNNPPIPDERPLWQLILHVFNHSTHHRAEAAAILTTIGHPPESVDMIDYIRREG
ncbi:DinB family protein [Tepidiforma sp.]|uniref:DinB family protein n=1 Tax=Tepidiforma sp. TaxID=2682230 RepID=UPI002ADE25F5|nr:DinB family protein [Tepidiforma sp.]